MLGLCGSKHIGSSFNLFLYSEKRKGMIIFVGPIGISYGPTEALIYENHEFLILPLEFM